LNEHTKSGGTGCCRSVFSMGVHEMSTKRCDECGSKKHADYVPKIQRVGHAHHVNMVYRCRVCEKKKKSIRE
jgi:hypothetical protein